MKVSIILLGRAVAKFVQVPSVLMETVGAAHNEYNLSSSLQDHSACQQVLWKGETFNWLKLLSHSQDVVGMVT